MAINCNEITQVATELKMKFESCAVLEAADMDKLVELIEVVNSCGEANDNNLVKILSPREVNFDEQVIDSINALETFTVEPNEIVIYEIIIGGILHKFIHKAGKGTYGNSQTPLTNNQISLIFDGSSGGGEGGSTNLGNFANTSSVIITSSTGASTEIKSATEEAAGVISSFDKIKLNSQSGINTGDQDISGIASNAIDIVDLRNNKVDKEAGKGLSDENYTLAEKTKLSNISGTNTGDDTASIQTKRPLKTINGESLETILLNGEEDLEIIATPAPLTTEAVQTARPIKDINGQSLEGSGNLIITGSGDVKIQVPFVEDLRTLDTSSLDDGTPVEVLAHNPGGFDAWDLLNIVDSETVYDVTPSNLTVNFIEQVYAINAVNKTIEFEDTSNDLYKGTTLYNASLEVVGTVESVATVFSPTRQIATLESAPANINVGDNCYLSESIVIGNPNKVIKATRDNKTYSYDEVNQEFTSIIPTAWSGANVSYTKGDIRTYVMNGETYYVKCNYSHISKSYYAPNTSNVNRSDVWEVTADAPTRSDWSADTEYLVNDVVSYDSVNYKCIRQHYSLTNWNPELLLEKYNQIINKKLGGGTFIFRKTPEFTATSGFTWNTLDKGYSVFTGSFTPAKRSYPKGENDGQAFITTNGTIIKILKGGNDDIINFNGVSYPKSAIGALVKGGTSFSLTAFAFADKESVHREQPNNLTARPTISLGESFYVLDDNGTVVNNFDGLGNVVGAFEREIPNGYINFEMFGATPHLHPYVFELFSEEEKHSDDKAIQSAMDNLYYPVKQQNGYFYTNKTIQLKIQKEIKLSFGAESITTDKGWTSGTSAIFIDNPNIDVVELKGSFHDCVINTDTSIVRGNSVNQCNHVTANLRQFNLSRTRNCEFNMYGSTTAIHKYKNIHNGFVVDDRYRTYVSDFREPENAGTYHFSDIRLRYKNVDKGFWVTNSNGRLTSINGLTVEFLGCFNARQFLVTDRQVGRSKFIANVWQLADVMSWEDGVTNNVPAIKLIGGGTFLDGQMMDAGLPPVNDPIIDFTGEGNFADLTALATHINTLAVPVTIVKNGSRKARGTIIKAIVDTEERFYFSNASTGLYGLGELQILSTQFEDALGIYRYMPSTLVELGGYGVQLGNSMLSYFQETNFGRIKNIEATYEGSSLSLTGSKFVIPTSDNSSRFKGVISKLDNAFLFINKRASRFYNKAFDSNGVDLNTVTISEDDARVTEYAGIIPNPEGVFDRNSSGISTSISESKTIFPAGSDVLNSYTEILVSGNNMPDFSELTLFTTIGVRQAQLIVLNDTTVIRNVTKNASVDNRFDLEIFTFNFDDIGGGNKTIIIRLIGSKVSQGEPFEHVPIDIVAVDKSGQYQPYIHTGGGQNIYGNLGFTSGNGIVLRSPDGNTTRTLTIDNSGNIALI